MHLWHMPQLSMCGMLSPCQAESKAGHVILQAALYKQSCRRHARAARRMHAREHASAGCMVMHFHTVALQ